MMRERERITQELCFFPGLIFHIYRKLNNIPTVIGVGDGGWAIGNDLVTFG